MSEVPACASLAVGAPGCLSFEHYWVLLATFLRLLLLRVSVWKDGIVATLVLLVLQRGEQGGIHEVAHILRGGLSADLNRTGHDCLGRMAY